MRGLFTLLLFNIFLLGLPGGDYQYGKSKNVLVVASYNLQYNWTSDVFSGIVGALSDSRNEVRVELLELDSARIPDREREQILRDKFISRIGDDKYDAIVLIDADALKTAADNNHALPYGVPVVFCGVSRSFQYLAKRIPGSSGVFHPRAVDRSINRMLFSDKRLKKVIVLTDYSLTGRTEREELEKSLAKSLPFLNYEFISEKRSTRDMLEFLSHQNRDTLLLVLNWKCGYNERFVNQQQLRGMVRKVFPGVICSIDDSWVNDGSAMGGLCVNAAGHGRECGEMVRRAMHKNMNPEMKNGECRWVFNYEAVRKRNFDRSCFPTGAEWIGMPEHGCRRGAVADQVLWGVLGLMAVLVGGVIFWYGRRSAVLDKCGKILAVQRILQQSSGIIALIRRNGDYYYLSKEDEYRRRSNIPSNRNLNVFDVYGADFGFYLLSFFDIVKLSGQSFDINYQFAGRFMRGVCSWVKPEENREELLLFSSIDILDGMTYNLDAIKKYEALTGRDERFRMAAADLGLAWFVTDNTGGLLEKFAASKVWRNGPDGTPLPMEDVLSDMDVVRLKKFSEDILSGKNESGDCWYRFDDNGENKIFTMKLRRIDEDRIFGVVVDATRMWRYEQQLAEANSFLQMIIDNLPCFFFVKDAGNEFRYLLVNSGFTSLFGLAAGEVVGRRNYDLWGDEPQVAIFEHSDMEAAANGECDTIEELATEDGGVRRIRVIKKYASLSGKDILLCLGFDLERFQFPDRG